MKRLYHPVLYFFMLPLFYTLLGSTFALRYQSFNYISFILFYVFILINQMLENILLRIPTTDFQLSKSFVSTLEIINLLLVAFFGWRHSWLAALVLLSYSAIIQLQFLFSFYGLDKLAVFISNTVKVILLNFFSFYIHTSFIHYRFLPLYLGIFIPFLLYELARLKTDFSNKEIISFCGAAYLVGGILLWEYLAFSSFLLLVSLPFAYLLSKTFNKKSTAMFAMAFSTMFILLSVVIFHY